MVDSEHAHLPVCALGGGVAVERVQHRGSVWRELSLAVGLAEQITDELELLNSVVACEGWLPGEDFSEYASGAPHIDR